MEIVTLSTAIANAIYRVHVLVKYELTADTPCPTLRSEPWDAYIELHAQKILCYIGIRL